jgi:hypothetical protein
MAWHGALGVRHVALLDRDTNRIFHLSHSWVPAMNLVLEYAIDVSFEYPTTTKRLARAAIRGQGFHTDSFHGHNDSSIHSASHFLVTHKYDMSHLHRCASMF